AGLRRAGARPRVAREAEAIAQAPLVLLPGVGAFGPGMQELRAHGVDDALRARVAADKPLLAVCLGLQLLCERSDEAPGERGLGIVRGDVAHFARGVRAPQFGWNRIAPESGCRFLRAGYAYFANSYRLAAAPSGWCAATAEHGGSFVAALERGSVLACQFHPELSGASGNELLQRWIAEAAC